MIAHLGGVRIAARSRLIITWMSANHDLRTFGGDADEFRASSPPSRRRVETSEGRSVRQRRWVRGCPPMSLRRGHPSQGIDEQPAVLRVLHRLTTMTRLQVDQRAALG